MFKEIALKSVVTFACKELWSGCSGYWTDRKLKKVVDLLHKDLFFDNKLKSLKTDVRVSVFGKSDWPFASKFVLKARSLELDQKSKKKFSKSKSASGPFDGVVGYVLTRRSPYIENNLPCYRYGSPQEKSDYILRTHMKDLTGEEIANFKYYARSYFGVFVQHNDHGTVKYVILLESEQPNYFGRRVSKGRVISDFNRYMNQQ